MKQTIISITFGLIFSVCHLNAQNIVAYWDQNSNSIITATGTDYGFAPGDFPQSADQGSGTIVLGNFDASTTTTSNGSVLLSTIASFSGTTTNDLSGASGGSLSPTGGPSNINNGMYVDFNVSTVGFSGISVSWAQRGTSSGFSSRAFSYSSNGGASFTLFDTDSGALSSSWVVENYDLSQLSVLNDNPNVVFRITLDGATSATGNNRFDNILVSAVTVVPEPATIASIMGLLGLAFVMVRRRR